MKIFLTFLFFLITFAWAAEDLNAQRRGGGGRGGGRGGAHFSRGGARASVHARPSNRMARHSNVSRPADRRAVDRGYVNRDVDIRRPVNVRNVDVNYRDNRWDGCCHYHPIARAAVATAAVATTAAVIGSTVYSLPSSCTTVIEDGVTYEQCGSGWYRPQFMGTSTTYVVVSPPR